MPRNKDRHLDIPSEANRDKHIDFESTGNDDSSFETDEATKERQRRWREGLEEGKKARRGEK